MNDLQIRAIGERPHIEIRRALRQLRKKLENVFEGGDLLPGFRNDSDPFGRSPFAVKLDLWAQRQLFVALRDGGLSAKAVADDRHKVLPR